MCYAPRMASDGASSDSFYQTRWGAVSVRVLSGTMTRIWPDLSGLSVLGLGDAVPYLRSWREKGALAPTSCTIAAMPEQVGLRRWPRNRPSLACAVTDDLLPFPDLAFDRVLLVHGLESTDNARRLLREVWRVLKHDGRLLVIVPNRSGLWAHSERTPFGQGRPFSTGQLARVLQEACFHPERREAALYMPPTNLRFILRTADIWERAGKRLLGGFAGVLLVEAIKDAYAPILPKARRRLIVMEPV